MKKVFFATYVQYISLFMRALLYLVFAAFFLLESFTLYKRIGGEVSLFLYISVMCGLSMIFLRFFFVYIRYIFKISFKRCPLLVLDQEGFFDNTSLTAIGFIPWGIIDTLFYNEEENQIEVVCDEKKMNDFFARIRQQNHGIYGGKSPSWDLMKMLASTKFPMKARLRYSPIPGEELVKEMKEYLIACNSKT